MSQVLDALNFLSANSSAMVASGATRALQFQQALQTGQISQAEYLDLMNDLAANVRIAEAADDLSNKILLEQCLHAAIAVAGAI
jgi:hypothetical protein